MSRPIAVSCLFRTGPMCTRLAVQQPRGRDVARHTQGCHNVHCWAGTRDKPNRPPAQQLRGPGPRPRSPVAPARNMNELPPRDEALSRAQAEVEQTRAIMKTVLDNMSEAVCLYDKNHVLLFLNDMFGVMHDFMPGELRVGMTIED